MKINAYLNHVRNHIGKGLGDLGLKSDFMMLTGARLQAANACLVDHYDPANRTLLLTSGTSRGVTKAPTETRMPVCKELAEMLERLIKTRKLELGQKFFKGERS